MKRYLILSLALQVWAAPIRQTAEQYYQQHDFKTALKTWEELLEDSPRQVPYALKVAGLKLLLEGRNSALKFLEDFKKESLASLSSQEIQELKRKSIDLYKVFLSEEAQVHYLQALSKTKLKDWLAGQALINHALLLEPGNLQILELKVEIDKTLGAFSAAYETLKQLYTISPESEIYREKLAEYHLFHGQFEAAKAILEGPSKFSLSQRSKFALAVALWELGQKSQSRKMIEDLVQNRESSQTEIAPPLLWMLHRMELDKSKNSKDAKAFLAALKEASSEKTRFLVDGWDPYRLSAYLDNFSK